MSKNALCFLLLMLFPLANVALADRGQVSPAPVVLAEESQRAIILHNQEEEVLILGTEMRADRKTGILEFIPFPSEPAVSPALGDPFAALQELIAQKSLEFLEISKGAGATVPVELKFSAKIGAHDVTVIKLNGIEGFSQWVEEFFRKKGIPIEHDLGNVYRNADDYLKRGYNYFVFNYVPLERELRSVEPLVYRFGAKELYYPLKTSNIIGGTGVVELALFLPGSLGLLTDRSDLRRMGELFGHLYLDWNLSSSSKVYAPELEAIHPGTGGFFKGGKIYLQVVRFHGEYRFKDDLALDIANIAPYAYKHSVFQADYGNSDYPWMEGRYELAEPLSPDEKEDILEAYERKRPEWLFTPEMLEAIRGPINGEGDGKDAK